MSNIKLGKIAEFDREQCDMLFEENQWNLEKMIKESIDGKQIPTINIPSTRKTYKDFEDLRTTDYSDFLYGDLRDAEDLINRLWFEKIDRYLNQVQKRNVELQDEITANNLCKTFMQKIAVDEKCDHLRELIYEGLHNKDFLQRDDIDFGFNVSVEEMITNGADFRLDEIADTQDGLDVTGGTSYLKVNVEFAIKTKNGRLHKYDTDIKVWFNQSCRGTKGWFEVIPSGYHYGIREYKIRRMKSSDKASNAIVELLTLDLNENMRYFVGRIRDTESKEDLNSVVDYDMFKKQGLDVDGKDDVGRSISISSSWDQNAWMYIDRYQSGNKFQPSFRLKDLKKSDDPKKVQKLILDVMKLVQEYEEEK